MAFRRQIAYDNDRGELLNLMLTPGNLDDRKPVSKLVRKLFRKFFGDKGYLSKSLRNKPLQAFNSQHVTDVCGSEILQISSSIPYGA